MLLVEQSSYQQPRVGELLSPSGQTAIRELLPERYQEFFLTEIEVTGAWNSDHCLPFSQETWWTLDRCGLDRALAEAAQAAGAQLYLNTRIKKVERERERWKVVVGEQILLADYLVDATGRSYQLAKSFGASRKRYDRQVALVGFLAGQGTPPAELLLETIPTGWWYSAPICPGHAVAVFLTDNDLDKGEAEAAWHQALQRTVHTQRRFEGFQLTEKPRRVSSDCSITVPCVGDAWMAVGDAASSFDPLSALGVGRAAAEGVRLGRSLLESLNQGQKPDLLFEAEEVGNAFSDHQASLAGEYRQVRRYAEEPFWSRRMSGMGAPEGFSRVRNHGAPLSSRPLIFPESQRFECTRCGKCCRSDWKPEIEPKAELGIRRNYRALPLKTESDGRVFLKEGEQGCYFLDSGGDCGIHESSYKPLGCRQFPFVFRETPDGIVVGLSHLCPSVQRNEGRDLSTYAEEIRQLLSERPPVVVPRSFPVSWGRAIDWATYLRLETFLLSGATVRDQVRALRYYLARWLQAGADSELSLEGEAPLLSLYELECLLALFYTVKVEGGDPASHWDLIMDMSEGRPVRLARTGWEGEVASLKSLIQVDEAPWLFPQVERYLKALVERKFLLVQGTVYSNLLTLAALPHLLLHYTVIHQLQRGGSKVESEDYEKALDLMETSLVTHGRQELPSRVFFKLDLGLVTQSLVDG